MATPALAPQVPNVAASRGRSPSVQVLTDSDSENIPPSTQEAGDTAPSAPSSPAEAFHLIVRSERTKDKDITLLVRPTHTHVRRAAPAVRHGRTYAKVRVKTHLLRWDLGSSRCAPRTTSPTHPRSFPGIPDICMAVISLRNSSPSTEPSTLWICLCQCTAGCRASPSSSSS